jgi:hypothetical protein
VAADITSTFGRGGDRGQLQTQDAGVISYWHWEYNPSGFKDRFFDGAPELQAKVAEAAAARSKHH